jgi:nitrite reductase/ring-hydroxylating ferredoxin subunit
MTGTNRLLDADPTGFHQCWYPVALARDVVSDKPLGIDLLGTRVVAWRDAAGAPVIQSAWCPHLGADLSQGEMVEGHVRCPYHHWRFDHTGKCTHIPTGDKIPTGARVFAFPTAETWGLVWAFNGNEPLFPPPGIPGVTERDLAIQPRARSVVRPLPPWVATSNGVDFQHLRTLHALPTSAPDAIEVSDYAIEYRLETERYLQHGRITGTNVFAQHLRRDGMDTFMLFTGAPINSASSRGFYTVGVYKGGDTAADRQRTAAQLDGVCSFVEKLLAEDDPVLNTMRFRVGVLTASDRHLARFFKYVGEFPRAAVPA